jgi:hypothetical protein
MKPPTNTCEHGPGIRARSLFLPACCLWLLVAGCEFVTEKYVVSGQVSRIPEANLNTATVVVGKVRLSLPDPMATPDPWDTSFSASDVPVWLTPTSGAQTTVNALALPERVPGIYFTIPDSLEYLHAYDLRITVNDPVLPGPIAAHAVLPDSFSIVQPLSGDSVSQDSVRVCWSRSDSAQLYTIQVTPTDTASPATGFLLSLSDTFVLVEPTAFQDSLTNQFLAGEYQILVWAINGGWKRGTDLLLNGGNVSNAVGLFGAATYARTRTVSVR